MFETQEICRFPEHEVSNASYILIVLSRGNIVYMNVFKEEELKIACETQAILMKQYGEGESHLIAKEEFIDIIKEGCYSIETGNRKVT